MLRRPVQLVMFYFGFQPVLDLRDLNLFVRAAKRKNFAAAGRELNLSPASTSQRIQALESDFGARLFHRTTRRVSLTEQGRILLVYAERMLADLNNAKDEIREKKRPTGLLRVTASEAFGRQHIAPHVTEFLDKYPGLKLQLDLSTNYADLAEQGLDLAIRIGNLQNSSTRSHKLLQIQGLVCASPAYLEANGIPKTPEDLAHHSCLIFRNQRNWTLNSVKRPIAVDVDGPFESGHGETIKQAAIDGLGLALRSTWDVAEEITQGRLMPVLTNYGVAEDRAIWAVYTNTRQIPLRVRLFVKFLCDKFGRPEAHWDQLLKRTFPR